MFKNAGYIIVYGLALYIIYQFLIILINTGQLDITENNGYSAVSVKFMKITSRVLRPLLSYLYDYCWLLLLLVLVFNELNGVKLSLFRCGRVVIQHFRQIFCLLIFVTLLSTVLVFVLGMSNNQLISFIYQYTARPLISIIFSLSFLYIVMENKNWIKAISSNTSFIIPQNILPFLTLSIFLIASNLARKLVFLFFEVTNIGWGDGFILLTKIMTPTLDVILMLMFVGGITYVFKNGNNHIQEHSLS